MGQQNYRAHEWTTELAYAVGLLVTDGNLSGDGRHIILRSKDKVQIENFMKCLGLDNKVGRTAERGNVCYRVQFGNVRLYKWLESIGLFQAKSYTVGAIKVPRKFLRDFVRGHLDGDGNVQVYWDEHNIYKERSYKALRVYVRFISASEAHARWLRKSILKEVGIKGALIKNKPKRKGNVPIWEIKYAKKEALALFEWVYYNDTVPCLSRKRALAERAEKLQATVRRRKYAFLKGA